MSFSRQKLSLSIAVIAGAFILLYASTFQSFYHAWMTDEDYSHGFLIIPISLYLIWRKRAELLQMPIQPSNWGIAILAAWSIMYFLGYAGEISTFVSYSMIVFIFGAVVTLAGYSVAKAILFPVLFLVFMIPIPSEIYTALTNPMKLLATTASVWIMQLFNVPVYQEGNLMHLPNYSMKVVMACSGIRSLISVTALALLMGYILFASNLRRLVLFLFSIPVALLGNIFRITVTGMIAYFISSDMAEGYSHTMAGLVTFAFSFILLFLGVYLIQWTVPERG